VDILKYTMLTYVDNVTLTIETELNEEMSAEVDELANGKFKGKNESTFKGLKRALDQAKQNNFIVLFSDEVGDDTTDPAAKQEIIDLVASTESKIFFLMIPRDNHPLEDMENNFEGIGTVIDITSQDQQDTINMVLDGLKQSEICDTNNADNITNTNSTNDTNNPTSAPGQLTSQLSATCTSRMKVYFDGVEQTKQDNDQDPEMVSTFDIPEDTKVIAIECDNANSQDSGDILASTEDGLFTDSSWTCTSNSNIPDWTAADFEDPNGDFTEAIAISENSGPSIEDISEDAQFIWVDDDSDWAGCRLVL